MWEEIRKQRRKPRLCGDQSGVIAVVVVILMTMILGFAALALDIGHLMVVRNQLQNAADATALTAAAHLFPHTPVILPSFPPPDWTAGDAEAANAIGLNKSDTVALTNCETECGYWDMDARGPSASWGPCNGAILAPSPITNNLAPAVRVSVSRSGTAPSAANGGAVRHWFAPVIGISTSNVSAKATAVLRSPGQVRSNSVIPVAISKHAYDTIGINVTFDISNHDTYGGTEAGQWTTFLEANASPPSTTHVRELLEYGNPTGINVGTDSIYLITGVHNSLYAGGGSNNVSVQRDYAGKDVFLPVVDAVLPGTYELVVGLVGFHIDSAEGGSAKVITGHFTTEIFTGGGPIGPGWGPMDYSRLVE